MYNYDTIFHLIILYEYNTSKYNIRICILSPCIQYTNIILITLCKHMYNILYYIYYNSKYVSIRN